MVLIEAMQSGVRESSSLNLFFLTYEGVEYDSKGPWNINSVYETIKKEG